jgi:hypothetical protein
VRDAIARAVELVLVEPGTWVVALAGFLARGGVLLFVLLLVELPSPITVTLIFGVDAVTGTGQPSERLVVAIVTGVVVAGVTLLAMLVAAAWTDVVAYSRARPAIQPERGFATRPERGMLASLGEVLGVAWLQAVGLIPALIAFALAAPIVGQVAVGELLLPSSSEVPYLLRVIAGAQLPLVRAVVVLALVELVVTVATRRYLGAGSARSVVGAFWGALATIARRPFAIAGAWMLGWIVLVGAAGAGVWAVSHAWGEVRSVFLDRSLALPLLPGGCQAAACADPGALALSALGAAAAVALFVAVWIAALAAVGVASAFRSSLWTLVVSDPAAARLGVRWPADAPV